MSATDKTFLNNNPPSVEDDDLNGFKNENNNLIEGANIVLSTADNQQTHKAVSHYAAGGDYYNETGVADAYVLGAVSPRIAPPAYFVGMRIRFIVGNINTGASTINVAGLGVKSLQLFGEAMPPGRLFGEILASYDGTAFQLIPSQGLSDYIDLKSGRKNKIINGNPLINQRAVSGTVVLLAGVYGHDRFRAGVGGCTYTFATSANVTTITITAGTLEQEIEGLNLFSGIHVLSWLGTAQAQIDGGGYGDTGVSATLTGGTNAIVEFGTGTVSKIQLEAGSVATLFEHRSIGEELTLCQRYYETGATTRSGYLPVGTSSIESQSFAVEKRAVPTTVLTAESELINCSGITVQISRIGSFVHYPSVVTVSPGHCRYTVAWTAEAEL